MYCIVDECFENHRLNMVAWRDMYDISSVQVCIALCMTETDVICRSINFYDGGGYCFLHKETKYTKPDKYESSRGSTHCTVGKLFHLNK